MITGSAKLMPSSPGTEGLGSVPEHVERVNRLSEAKDVGGVCGTSFATGSSVRRDPLFGWFKRCSSRRHSGFLSPQIGPQGTYDTSVMT